MFGPSNWCFYIIDGFEDEYMSNSRLTAKFHWASEQKYQDNRTRSVSMSKDERGQVQNTIDFITDTAHELDLGTGKVDIQALAIAYVLGIPIATDDSDMIELANEFQIKIYKVLDILKYLETNAHIDRTKVRAIVKLWRYLNDKPKNLKEDYKAIFNEDLPDLDA